MVLKRNLWLLAAGLLAIVGGYLLLAAQRLSWGPLLLVAGYCILLPLFIWRLFRQGVDPRPGDPSPDAETGPPSGVGE